MKSYIVCCEITGQMFIFHKPDLERLGEICSWTVIESYDGWTRTVLSGMIPDHYIYIGVL